MIRHLNPVAIATLTLLVLSACNNSPTSTPSSPSPSPAASETAATSASPSATTDQASKPTSQATTETATAVKDHNHGGHGGQIIETGKYHLELVTIKEGNDTHLDFYLQQGENHVAIPTAKVVAQIQLPDGTQKSLNLTYDKAGQHYYGVLPATTAGTYKIAILSDIQGEKVNARYTVQQ